MRTKRKPHLTADQVIALLKQQGRCSAYTLAEAAMRTYPQIPEPRVYPTVTAALRALCGWKVRKVGFEDAHPNGGKRRVLWEAV